MRTARRIPALLLALFIASPSSAQTDFLVESTFDIFFTSRRFSTGAPFALAGTPAVAAYEDNGTTEITAGITLTTDFDTRTGLNHLRIVATGANGYEAGKSYALVITAGTVDSVSVVGEVVGHFTLERSALANDAITAAKMATDAIGAAELAGDVPSDLLIIVTSGTADSGSTTTMVDAGLTQADTDYWKDSAILFVNGSIAGQARRVTAFNAATDTITFAPATTQAVGTNLYAIFPRTAGVLIDNAITAATIAASAVGSSEAPNLDAAVSSRLAPTVAARTLDVTATGEAGLDLDNTAGTLAKGTEITGFSDLSAAQVNAEVDTALDTAIPASPTAGSINERIRDLDDFFVIRRNTAQAGAASTITLDASASATDDFYNEYWIRAVSGTGPDQTRTITDYVGSTKVATITPNWNTNPDATTVFVIVGIGRNDALSAGTTDWGTTEKNQIRQALGIDGTKSATSGGNLDTVLSRTDVATSTRLAPTVAGRTLDVTATGEAGLDLDNTAGGLAKGTEITGFNDLSAAAVNAEVDTAIADARLDELLAADSDIDGLAPPTIGSVFHEALTKTAASFTYDQTTDSLEAVRDNMGTPQTGDSFARLGAPAGASVSADILVLDNFVDDLESRVGTPANLGGGATVAANLSDVEAQTDDIGAAGAGLTAIPSTDVVKNAALSDFEFLMVDGTDHVTPEIGLTITGQRSCDGAAFVAVSGTIAEVGSGVYQFDALAADTNCNIATWKFSATGADTFYFTFRTK